MEIFDLGIAWNWELDKEFVEGLGNYAVKKGLRPYLFNTHNFHPSKNITDNMPSFRFFFDRASDNDPSLYCMLDFLKEKNVSFINHPDRAKKSSNKFIMHFELINQKISVPYTIIITPQDTNEILELKIKDLPKPFVLKPIYGSGGEGIFLDINSLADILKVREHHKDITYLAQEKIIPINFGNKSAWFRIFFCFGDIIPCWWDPVTHIYDILTKEEISGFDLSELTTITEKIGKICKLDFFSTEITLKNKKEFVVIDYVNDQCDMRRKSKFSDGVPDEVMDKIISGIIDSVSSNSPYCTT